MKKELLAKLLATENITVVQKNVETASFDVKKRVLTMPVWNDDIMTEDTEDHLTGHEVGHALYTPADEWMEMAEDATDGLRSFVNVVEDARIERMIQVRYPGLRRSFIRSYNNMLKNGFFGKSKDAVNDCSLIDRLNIHFKCGAAAEVEFSRDELEWVEEISSAETFAEVVDIANRLYEAAKEELENAKMDLPSATNFGDDEPEYGEDYTDGEGEDEGKGDDSSLMDDDEASDEDGDSSDASTDGDGEEDGEGGEEEDEDSFGGTGFSEELPEEPISETDEKLNRSIKEEYSDNNDSFIANAVLDTKYPADKIVSPKEIIALYDDEYFHPTVEVGAKVFKMFKANNRATINYMVKEFEMKKRASEYSRTTLAKTGVIDPVKMNNYRYSDDIFRKMEVIPEGKNHGLLMYLDWSGSMCHDLLATTEQLMNIVMFCKQVQIPFRVFAFTDHWSKDRSQSVESVISMQAGTHLLELFNQNMNRNDFNKMCNIVMGTAGYYFWRYTDYRSASYSNKYENKYASVLSESPKGGITIPSQMTLGGTPLESCIIGGVPIYRKFKSDNRLDIVTTIFLSDGESHHYQFFTEDGKYTDFGNSNSYWNRKNGYKRITVTDPTTRKSIRVPKMEFHRQATDFLLTMYREFTDSNVIGFRILPYNKKHFRSELYTYSSKFGQIEELHTQMKKDKFITIPGSGYTKFFGIAGGKNLETANTMMQVSETAKKGAITTAFKKANGNRKTTRVMLNKFIDLVA